MLKQYILCVQMGRTDTDVCVFSVNYLPFLVKFKERPKQTKRTRMSAWLIYRHSHGWGMWVRCRGKHYRSLIWQRPYTRLMNVSKYILPVTSHKCHDFMESNAKVFWLFSFFRISHSPGAARKWAVLSPDHHSLCRLPQLRPLYSCWHARHQQPPQVHVCANNQTRQECPAKTISM